MSSINITFKKIKSFQIFILPAAAMSFFGYLLSSEVEIENAFKQKDAFVAHSYLYNFKSYRYDEFGKLTGTINSDIAMDIRRTGEIKLIKPSVQMHDNDSNTWVALADSGVIRRNEQTISLRDNVLVTVGGKGSNFKTQEIQFDFSKRTLHSQNEVAIFHDDGYTNADGMKGNLRSSNLELLGNVRTTYGKVID